MDGEIVKLNIGAREYNVRLSRTDCAESLKKILPVHSVLYLSNRLYYGELPARLAAVGDKETYLLLTGRLYYADSLQAIAVCPHGNFQSCGIGFVQIGEIEDIGRLPERDTPFALRIRQS